MLGALLGAAPGLASMAGGLFGMLGKKKNPADAANKYLNQIPGQMEGYYQPYQQAGGKALDTLQSEYGQLLNNPGEKFNQLGAGYKQSPGYQFALQQALNAGGNASAAGGMLGTPQHEQQSMETAEGLASKDYEDYINHILGMYQGGLGGTQGIEEQGYNANKDMANVRGSVLGQQAQNAFTGQQGANASRAQDWANIFGGAAAAGQGYNNYNQQQDFMNMFK